MSALVKILLPADPSAWHGMTGERVWASTAQPSAYRLVNNPLYAYGLSYGDIVSATPVEPGLFEFDRVLRRGGHANFRVLLRKGAGLKDFARLWSGIERLGCAYESAGDPARIFAIDVPPQSDLGAVRDLLEKGVAVGIWHLDEGNARERQKAECEAK